MARLTSNHREADVTTTRTGRRLLTVAAAAAAALVAAPAVRAATLAPNCTLTGTEQVCDVYASASSVTLAGTPPVPTWRFTDAGGQALLPLVVTQNDTVRIRLHNNLATAVSLAFPQLQNVRARRGCDPRRRQGRRRPAGRHRRTTCSRPRGRARSCTRPARRRPASSRSPWVSPGRLVVLPTTPGQAYAAAGTAYDTEDVLVLSEIDPALNTLADPATFNLRDYAPQFVLVNGQPTAHPIPATQNQQVLVRYVNAGAENHWAGLLGPAPGSASAPTPSRSRTCSRRRPGAVRRRRRAPGRRHRRDPRPGARTMPRRRVHVPRVRRGPRARRGRRRHARLLAVGGTLGLPACRRRRSSPPTVNGLNTPPTGHIANLGGAERRDERLHRHGPRARVPRHGRRGRPPTASATRSTACRRHRPAVRRRERRRSPSRSARRTWRRSRPAASTT